MLHVGLDLGREQVEVCLISDRGELIDRFAATADRDGLYGLASWVAVYGGPVRGVVESMNGARFVHDELVSRGWEVLVADAQKVKGLAPLACKTDQDRLGCAGGVVVPGSGAGDLAGDGGAAPGAGDLPVAAASGQASLDVEEPGALDADRLRPPAPHVGLVRCRRPPAVRDDFDIPEPWRSHVDASLFS